MKRWPCPQCNAEAGAPDYGRIDMYGKGAFICEACGWGWQEEDCPSCEGRGHVTHPEVPPPEQTCTECEGAGLVSCNGYQAWLIVPRHLRRQDD